jgi:hypothetical protein
MTAKMENIKQLAATEKAAPLRRGLCST